jgi:hypothetical protein
MCKKGLQGLREMRCLSAVLDTAKSMIGISSGSAVAILGGGASSPNQIVLKSALNLTQGNLKEY